MRKLQYIGLKITINNNKRFYMLFKNIKLEKGIKSMQERNVLAGMLATWLTAFVEAVEPVKWFLLAALCLIIADAKFGVEASRNRGEKIRKSRAIRRTINKMIDYICWIMVASSVGAAFGTPFGIPSIIDIALGYKLTASKSCIFFSIIIFSLFAVMVLPPEIQREMKF